VNRMGPLKVPVHRVLAATVREGFDRQRVASTVRLRMRGRSRLALTHARLTQWRAQHGGRGIPVPEELWAEVVKVARVEGAGTTARALRLDRARLEARMAMDWGGGGCRGQQRIRRARRGSARAVASDCRSVSWSRW
jgi:hypothetical protein